MNPQIILGPLVGGLTHATARLWARADGPAILYAWVGKKANLSQARPVGRVRLTAESGFCGVIPLTGLDPSTRYFYSVSLQNTLPVADSYPSFETFPLPGQNTDFSFAFGSCFRPGSGEIFQSLSNQQENDHLRFLLMIGDQIYADLDKFNGLGRIAVTVDDYRQVYKHVWGNGYFRKLLENLPVYMTLDDHEVDNDWHWDDFTRRWAHIPFYEQVLRWLKGQRKKDELTLTIHRVRDAMQAYWEHQGSHADGYIKLPRMDAAGRFMFHEDDGMLAYTFQFGSIPFFVMDTRTLRIETGRDPSLLGPVQWQALEKWLVAQRAAPAKFLVTSSSVLFSMFVDFAGDRWSGFREDRHRLLQFISDNRIENLYLLAGDLHSAHAIQTELAGGLKLWEFCSTPFEQDPNPVSWTYIPPFDSAIRHQWLKTRVVAHNYGVVRVTFEAQNQARVRFEIHGKDGGQLYPK